MGNPGAKSTAGRQQRGFRWLTGAVGLAACLFVFASGCADNPWKLAKQGSSRSYTEDDIIQSSLRMVYDPGPKEEEAAGELEKALELFRQGKYADSQRVLRRVSAGRYTPFRVAEEALFYEAEALRMDNYYPQAASTYSKLVKDFPRGAHHYDALKRMFEISDFWLNETRDEMDAKKEQRKGKRSFVWPVSFVHWERKKPVFDLEGHAVRLLETIYMNDLDGPLGEKAMFFLGSLHLFRDRFEDADQYFAWVAKYHPNGKYAARAIEMSIHCKQRIPGGPDYDGRTVAQARELVHTAMTAYPELRTQKEKYLRRQLFTINAQQAAKDLHIGDFYRRTGHAPSAFFYYEIVRRRYPGTDFAEEATRKMAEIRDYAQRHPSRGNWNVWDMLAPWRNADAGNVNQQPPVGPNVINQPAPNGFQPAIPNVVTPNGRRPEQAPPPRPLPPGA